MDILRQLQQGAAMDTFSTAQLYAALQSRQGQGDGSESEASAATTNNSFSKKSNKSGKSRLRIPLRLSLPASTPSTTHRSRTQSRTTSSKSSKSARKVHPLTPRTLAFTATNDRLALSLYRFTASASARRTPSSSDKNYSYTSKLNGSNDENKITGRSLVAAQHSPSRSVKFASREAHDTPNAALFLDREGPEVHRSRCV
jgi:hypothetical protein